MKDLLRLYSFESVHGTDEEQAISDWICKWLDAHDIKDYKRLGKSIYKKGKFDIILSAHLDQVKTNGKAVKFYMNDQGIIAAFNKDWEQTSLGADDKNGIWIILKALEIYGNDVSFIISEGEETGLIGIHNLDSKGVLKEMLSEYDTQCIVLDRKGTSEILDSGGSCKYCKTLAQCLCNFFNNGYTTGCGSCSDTQVLSEYCESVNMSVAYFNPHSASETTDFKALQKIKNDVMYALESFVHYNTSLGVYKYFKEENKYARLLNK